MLYNASSICDPFAWVLNTAWNLSIHVLSIHVLKDICEKLLHDYF